MGRDKFASGVAKTQNYPRGGFVSAPKSNAANSEFPLDIRVIPGRVVKVNGGGKTDSLRNPNWCYCPRENAVDKNRDFPRNLYRFPGNGPFCNSILSECDCEPNVGLLEPLTELKKLINRFYTFINTFM